MKKKPTKASIKHSIIRKFYCGFRLATLYNQGKKLVFIDETSIHQDDFKDQALGFKQYKPTKKHFKHGKKIKILAAISIDGVEGFMFSNKEFNTKLFGYFLEKLHYYHRDVENKKKKDGNTKENDYIYFLDNASPHRTFTIKELVLKTEMKLMFNVAQSPELNPIENFFGYIKSGLKSYSYLKSPSVLKNIENKLLDFSSRHGRRMFMNTLGAAIDFGNFSKKIINNYDDPGLLK